MRRSGLVALALALPFVLGWSSPVPSGEIRSEADLRRAITQAAPGETLEIHLGAGRLVRETGGPIVIGRQVKIVGAGATESVIDAAHDGQVFDITAGGRLELVGIALIGGQRDADASTGEVAMDRVMVAAASGLTGEQVGHLYDMSQTRMPQSCYVGMELTSQFFLHASITDPTALSGVLGDPF